MSAGYWLAFVLIFAAVSLLSAGLISSLTGTAERRLRARLAQVRDEGDQGARPASLIREKYLRQLSPLERLLEEQPGMRTLSRLCEQAGYVTPAYRVILVSLVAAVAVALLVLTFSAGNLLYALLGFAAGLPLPLVRILSQRRQRISRFEEQLPDALDLMSRALRAGMPFMESMKFVSEEMPAPIADEFRITWSHINYGIDMKGSFADLLERMPSVSLRAMTTAVLVQRETGGNLAEILDKISEVLRARFRFQRRLRTLTAEGRMSAIVLITMPFALAAVLSVSSPTYLPILLKDPTGQKIVGAGLAFMAIGILWIRKLIQLKP
jgi:tight adherence protein B